MMRRYGLLIAGLLVLLCVSSVCAQVPETIKSQFHPDRELGIKVITGRNVRDIFQIENAPAAQKIVVIQVLPKDMTPEMAAVLMKWIRGGGTLWFYDSRLAPFFGMEPSPLSSEGVNHKKLEGEYGDNKKYPGMAVVVLPYGDHPILTGVTGAAVFVMQVDDGLYSAVKSAGPVQGLLKVDLTKDAAVAAVREEGKGRIILKTLLWESQVDGARFQANVKEYSAGFPVPRISAKQSKLPDELLIEKKGVLPSEKVDILHLTDGRTVWGKVLNETITFDTPQKTVKVAVGTLKELECNTSSGIDMLLGADDRKWTGFLSVRGGIQFMTPSGTKVSLEKQDIKSIFFNRNKEADSRGRLNPAENSGGTR